MWKMDKRLYVELPPFTGRNVPITEIAKAIGKDAHYRNTAGNFEIWSGNEDGRFQ